MSWYNTQGPDQIYVLFSKVKYIRNLAKQNFCHLIDPKRASETYAKIESILQKNGFRGEKLGAKTTNTLLSLAEKHFIDGDLVFCEQIHALYLNEPCNLTVTLGGENCITISSIISGRSVEEAKNIASRAEELLDRELDFAYSENIGYLSPTVSECGSGLCFSSAVYLPSLSLRDSFEETNRELMKKGICLAPLFSHAKGDIYMLSYSPHYLASEKDSAAFFSSILSYLTEREKKSLSELLSSRYDELLNCAHRALGILLCSDILKESELIQFLSEIRLCHALSESAPPSLPDMTDLNYLSAEGLSSSIIASSKDACRDSLECDRARARLVSAYIKHKNEVDIPNGK